MRTHSYARLIRGSSIAAVAILLAATPQSAMAQAFQGSANVDYGTATIDRATLGTDNITISSPNGRATITWTPTDTALSGGAIDFLPSGNVVNYSNTSGQPTATVLNRIIPTSTTRAVAFNGQVNANSDVSVWFYSPTGLLIGSSATFDVGSLLLTASDLTVNGQNDFMATPGQFSVAGTANSTSAIEIQSGAQLKAETTGQSNYIVAVAPRIQQDGSVSVRGAAALVAAESADFAFDNTGLFNISVTQGSTVSSNTFTHTGTTGGPDSAAPGDHRRVYMVAIPKNNAITMAIQAGGSIGFAPALGASLDGNAVILTAGNNIADTGIVDKAIAGPVGTGNSSIDINGNATLSSRAFVKARNDVTVSGTVTVAGAPLVDIVAGGNLNVTGSIIGADVGSGVKLRADSQGTGTGTVALANGAINLTGGGSTIDIYHNPTTFGTPTDYSTGVSAGLLTTWQLINDVNQLQAVNTNVTANYALGKDIDASATSAWNSGAGFVSLGTDGAGTVSNTGLGFTGKFDGRGHTISSLTINRPAADFQGLFGYATNAEIAATKLVGGSITGQYRVGGLVGRIDGGQILLSSSSVAVDASGGEAGGIAGYAASGTLIADSSSSGAVSVTNGQFTVGGLVGYNGGNIARSWASGNVSWTGSASGSLVRAVGGLVGFNDGNIDQSYATGTVNASNSIFGIGGFVGYLRAGLISKSYALGDVTGGDAVGGFVGYAEGGTADQSYSTGLITGTSNTGGFIGNNFAGTISNSYWDSFSSGQGAGFGNNGGTIDPVTGLNAVTSDPLQAAATNYAYNESAYANFLYQPGVSDLDIQGGQPLAWRLYEGVTRPFLKAFLRPALVTGSLADTSVTYNGTSQATAVGNASLFNVVPQDSMPLNPALIQGTGTLACTGGDVSCSNAGIYTVSLGLYSPQQGYDLIFTNGTTAQLTVNKAVITNIGGLVAADKVYDGTNAVSLNLAGALFTGQTAADAAAGNLRIDGFLASFASPNAGNGVAVNVSGILLGGSGLSNYELSPSYTVSPVTANITPALITNISGLLGVNRVYDSTTTATLNTGGALFTGQTPADAAAGNLNIASYTADFASMNAGTGISINLSAVTLGGAGASNYMMAPGFTTNTITADITPATIIGITGVLGVNRAYDGTNSATLNSVTALFTGQTAADAAAGNLNIASYTANFASSNAGTGIVVNATGLTLGGAAAANYVLDPSYTINAITADITPALITNISGLSGVNRVYDSTTTATLNTGGALFAGQTPADAAAGNLNIASYTADFASMNAGTGIAINVSALTLAGAGASNYMLAPGFTTSAITADITPATITSITGLLGVNRAYDGTTTATLNSGAALFAGQTLADAAAGNLNIASYTANFASSNAGTGIVVNATGLTLGGAAAANYVLDPSYTINAITADITPALITNISSLVGNNKVYDGTTTAIVNTAGAVFAGQTPADAAAGNLNIASYTANFASFNAGTGIAINVTALTLGGTGASNYTLDPAYTVSPFAANITPATITSISGLLGVNKTFDGATTATLNSAGAVFAGQTVADAAAGNLNIASYTADFASPNAGTGIAVNISALTLGGAGAGNYVLSPSFTTNAIIADITPALLTITGITGLTGVNKVYDGTTTATLNTSGAVFVGSTPADAAAGNLNIASYTANFASMNAGTGITVNVSALTLGGVSAGNYVLSPSYTLNPITANITPAALTVTANAISRIYGDANPALTYTTSGLIGTDSLTGALSTSANGQSHVGLYTIDQGSLAASANYTLSYTGANLTVTPRALSVIANAATRSLGEANPNLTYTFNGSGLVNGDTLSGQLATTANGQSSPGLYAITQGSLAASTDYNLTFTGADFNVTRQLSGALVNQFNGAINFDGPLLQQRNAPFAPSVMMTAINVIGGSVQAAQDNLIADINTAVSVPSNGQVITVTNGQATIMPFTGGAGVVISPLSPDTITRRTGTGSILKLPSSNNQPNDVQ